MKIAVFGASGIIGSQVVSESIERGHEAIINRGAQAQACSK